VLGSSISPLVVIDSKHEIDLGSSFHIAKNVEQFKSRLNDKYRDGVIWRPTADEIDDPYTINEALRLIYNKKNTRIWIDELMGIVRGPASYPPYLKALYTQGRSRNCGILACTQRPSGIPLFALTESDVFIKFMLRMEQDQKRMATMMGNQVIEPKTYPAESVHRDEHSFFMLRSGDRQPREYLLDLGEK
jgi:hypothetical protein